MHKRTRVVRIRAMIITKTREYGVSLGGNSTKLAFQLWAECGGVSSCSDQGALLVQTLVRRLYY